MHNYTTTSHTTAKPHTNPRQPACPGNRCQMSVKESLAMEMCLVFYYLVFFLSIFYTLRQASSGKQYYKEPKFLDYKAFVLDLLDWTCLTTFRPIFLIFRAFSVAVRPFPRQLQIYVQCLFHLDRRATSILRPITQETMSTRTTSTYSHNGCTRCKKMKIKCDEKQPTCGACERKKASCVYEFPFVIYNPYLSKKKKKAARSTAPPGTAKVSKNTNSQPTYKLKAEDKRILQITLPSEFKFVAEKFDDETSSSSSTTASPKTVESQITSKAAQISKKYELLKASQNIESAFANQLSLDEQKKLTKEHKKAYAKQQQLEKQHQQHNLKVEHNSFLFDDNQWQTGTLSNQVVSPSAIPSLDVSEPVFSSVGDTQNASNVKLEEFDSDILAGMLGTDDLFAETAQLDGLSSVALQHQPLPELQFNFYTTHNVGVMVDYFAKAQPIIDAKHLTPEDPELSNLIWRCFISGKALSNHLFVDDDFHNNDLIDWLQVLAKNDAANHNIIFTSVTATTANGIYLQTNIYYWYVVKEKYMDYTISILKEYIDSSNSFILMSCLLFTVLLLYSERSGTDSPVWRFHLKGALGILKKINSIWNLEDIHLIERKSEELEAAINLFHFCECWFIAAESLAWVSSINGGSLPCETPQDIIDARQFLFGHLKYENQNPLVNDGFNTLRFCPQSLVEVMNEVVLHTMSLKVDYDLDLTELNGLLLYAPPTIESFYLGQQLLVTVQQHENDTYEFKSCKDLDLAETMRTTAKCFSIGIKCYILSNFMGYSIHSPEIQSSIPVFIEAFNKMPYLSQCAISIHWPCFFLACCTPPDSNLREQILKPLNIMVSQTMLAATFSIKRIKQIWRALDTNDYSNMEKVDTICF